MINAILEHGLHRPIDGFTILDVGCGNGGIASSFIETNEVTGVDVEDRRKNGVPDQFELVNSELLPFGDNAFDIVISHHVIEHVEDHGAHLDEMHRVVREDGHVYVATPNRSSPIMSGHVGNDMVLQWPEMRPLFEEHGFIVEEYGWRVFCEPDVFHGHPRFGRLMPAPIARQFRRWYPSHMFLLRPS